MFSLVFWLNINLRRFFIHNARTLCSDCFCYYILIFSRTSNKFSNIVFFFPNEYRSVAELDRSRDIVSTSFTSAGQIKFLCGFLAPSHEYDEPP